VGWFAIRFYFYYLHLVQHWWIFTFVFWLFASSSGGSFSDGLATA
jgi:hypothetical protein